MLGARLDANLEKELAKYAKKLGQTKSTVVKEALREYLSSKKSIQEHDRLTLKGWQQIENGEGLPPEDIYAYLDTWGPDEPI